MAFEQTWRWFGPKDPVTLKEIKQTGAVGIVSALHHISVGEVWPLDDIVKRKQMIEDEGLRWSVVESLPVHEDLKKRKGNYKLYLKNYQESITNLGQCGIDSICYNFMPVLDWLRTDLNFVFKDGSITTKFETRAITAFDLFILKRRDAQKDYNKDQIREAKKYYEGLNENQKDKLSQTVLLGFPGSLDAYTIEEFKLMIKEYNALGADRLRENLYAFIKDIIPVAIEAGVFMAIHPDDPPWSLLGLPRIIGNKADIKKIVDVIDSPANGITLCTGSFGAGYDNDLVEIAESFAHRINFIHLRNLTRNKNGDFTEAYHLEGDIDLYGVMKVLLLEQKRRINAGRKDTRLPMRADHGHLMTVEQNKEGIYPGYSLFGRMRGLAELRGMEIAIRRSLGLK